MDYITKEDIIIFSPFFVFDKKIDDGLLSNYKKIIFSNYKLTNNLFDNYANNNLDNLKFIGSKFNQKVDLPWNLKYLCLYCETTLIIDYLPDSLEELKLGEAFNSSLDNLSISLQILKISNKYDKNKLNNLPKNIQIISY